MGSNSNKDKNKTRLGVASVAASFWALLASGFSSLALTNEWFGDDLSARGAFIIGLGLSTLVIRIVIILCGNSCINTSDKILALAFIGVASLSDAVFDIVQGCVLLFGHEYSTDATIAVLLGTWIGFADEVLEFLQQILSFFYNLMILKKSSAYETAYYVWLVWILIDCVVEQCCGIYIATQLLADDDGLFALSLVLNCLTLVIVIAFAVYISSGGRQKRLRRQWSNESRIWIYVLGDTDVTTKLLSAYKNHWKSKSNSTTNPTTKSTTKCSSNMNDGIEYEI
jgi:hypothetical protein